MKEEDRRGQAQSFMWLFRSGEDGLPTIILYGYSPTRSGRHAKGLYHG
ncbi:IS66 family transposase [Roseburia sp. 1XD42-69]